MPMQNIHLHSGHSVEVAFEHVERNEVTADVDEQAAPGEPGLILDRDGGNGESA